MQKYEKSAHFQTFSSFVAKTIVKAIIFTTILSTSIIFVLGRIQRAIWERQASATLEHVEGGREAWETLQMLNNLETFVNVSLWVGLLIIFYSAIAGSVNEISREYEIHKIQKTL